MINIGQYIEMAINWMMIHFSTFHTFTKQIKAHE